MREEILELLKLKGWSPLQLAAELDIKSPSTVARWIAEDRKQRRNPGGPASILLRQWLAAARKEKELAGAK